MRVENAVQADAPYLRERDRHLMPELLESKIRAKEILLLRSEEGHTFGWLRFGYFWDNLPFLNLLWLDEEYRGKGFGKQAVLHWEDEMRRAGHGRVLTSTLANEGAQHFYRKLGYRDAGCLLLPDEPLEILLLKELGP